MKLFTSLILTILSVLIAGISVYAAETKTYTFFSQTQHPLKVYYLEGNEPGPTVMIQAGIQGDETTGFYTAQLLSNASLQKGNLIIVPRANIPAILKGKRLINVDLNRRFDQEYSRFYEDRLARAIRFLIGQCDAFVHLHEGSGFYHPNYINSLRNPNRWGQSFIIDSAVYKDEVHLAKHVKKTLPRVNSKIVPAQYRFELFNTKTGSPDTKHPEQRKSLTYYALNTLEIPAMAIEVSKNITNKPLKLKHQLMATQKLLKQLKVKFSMPDYSKKELSRMLDKKDTLNTGLKTRQHTYEPGETVELFKSSQISAINSKNASDSKLSPKLGVFLEEFPKLNLLACDYVPRINSSTLQLSSDGKIKAKWPVENLNQKAINFFQDPEFLLSVNGELKFVSAGGEINCRQGDRFILLGVWNGGKEEILNVKGYVSNPRNNRGQDKGHEIILNQDFFISRYLDKKSGSESWSFDIVRETSGKKRVKFSVKVLPRKIRGIKLSTGKDRKILLPFENKQTYHLPKGKYKLETILGPGKKELFLPIVNGAPVNKGGNFTLSQNRSTRLDIYNANSFRKLGEVAFSSNKFN